MDASEEAEVVVAAELTELEDVLLELDEQPASAKQPPSRRALSASAATFARFALMFFKSSPFIERNRWSPLTRDAREWRPREDSNLRRTV